MKRIKRLAVLISLLVILSLNASADRVASEFGIIAQKNVFRLNPPIRKTEPVVELPELPLIRLLGTANILGIRQALLSVQTKTNSGMIEVSCVLGERQSCAGVVVTKIAIDSRTVWLTNQGAEQILRVK